MKTEDIAKQFESDIAELFTAPVADMAEAATPVNIRWHNGVLEALVTITTIENGIPTSFRHEWQPVPVVDDEEKGG